MKEIKVVQIYTSEDCRHGLCDCAGAEECKFPRCSNCDNILGKDGKWIEDDQYYNWDHIDHCPDCGGPLE